MKYAYTILYVENVSETVDFYTRAFGFEKKFVTPEEDYAELFSGETTISFASVSLANQNIKSGFQKSTNQQKPFGIELAFTTENIEHDFKHAVEAGAILVEEIQTKPWGQQVGYLKDINGFLIEVCTPINS